jgi:hypothetical protein
MCRLNRTFPAFQHQAFCRIGLALTCGFSSHDRGDHVRLKVTFSAVELKADTDSIQTRPGDVTLLSDTTPIHETRQMRPSGAANTWEFRWRWPILIGSQPALALLAHVVSGVDELWYAPELAPGIGWLAVIVATLGILFRIQATTSLRAAVMAADDPDTSRFVSDGLYRSVRNPLYLSSLLLFGGYGLCFG